MRCLVCLPLLIPFAAAAQVRIDAPVGGWRSPDGAGAGYTQRATYPAANVGTPDAQSDAARVRGRIEGAPKSPALLVVNGTAMPLMLDEAGGFDRPWLFNRGSNSVEVRDAQRSVSRRVQFHAGGEGQVPARLRVLLSWDSGHTDLDLHVVTPDGAHAWYGGRVLPNGGALDVDVTTGHGPEIFSSPTPLPGRYLVFVNYYGAGESAQDLTVASIDIVSAEGTENEKRQGFRVPLRNAGELTLVAAFSYP